MTNLYNSKFNVATKEILKRINASDELKKTLVNILENKYLSIYENQIINALAIAEAIYKGGDITTLVASMQSGKTDTAYVLANYIMPSMGLLDTNETVLFVTSMRDKDLFLQNKIKIERDFFDFNKNESQVSRLRVEKMDHFKEIGSKIISDFKVKYVVRDEDQYGCGQESSFDLIYFNELKKVFKDLKLISISATPFDVLDSKVRGNDVELIVGDRPKNYFGITEMINEGHIYDLPRRYKPIKVDFIKNKKVTYVHKTITDSIEYLLRFDDGYGIVRVNNSKEGDLLKKELENYSQGRYIVKTIGSTHLADQSIKEGLKTLYNDVVRNKKKVVLIIVQALSAGKDLGKLKEYFRFGIEPRRFQLANGAQGIPGRICGYHENRNFIIHANRALLEHYSEFENDPEVYADEEWRNDLFSMGRIGELSTHVKLERTIKQGFHSNICQINTYGVDDIFSHDIFEELHFLDFSSIEKLRNFFTKEYYNFSSSHFRLNKNCSVRLASSYKDTRRLYREWDNSVGDSFSKIFFRGAKQVKYGILISNFPQTHIKNKINFCGIKVFTSGGYSFKKQETSTINKSMYVEPDEE